MRRFSGSTLTVLLVAVGITSGVGAPGVCQVGAPAKLVAQDGAEDDRFGTSVALDGDLCVGGARWDDERGENSGAAYVFRHVGDEWIEEVKLTASDASEFSRFGQSVSISGDTVAVGAPRKDDVGSDSGAVYLFRFVENGWMEEDKVTASDAAGDDRFGVSVSISDDAPVVGSRFDDDSCPGAPDCNSGSAYVFRRVGSTWTQEDKLVPADATDGMEFGISVAIDRDTVVIGAYRADVACPTEPSCDSGSAYLYRLDGVSWNEQARLLASDADAGDRFGASVSVWEQTVIIGAERNGDAGQFSGAAYIFHRAEGGWDDMTETSKITASDAEGSDRFGVSVSVHGELAVVGARNEDSRGSNAGAAYVYRHNGSYWAEQRKLAALDSESGDRLGVAVANDGELALVGAPQEDSACPALEECNSGAAYMFDVAFGEFDLLDCARLQRCFTGAGPADPTPSSCLFDFDLDKDVDLLDWRTFTGTLVGP